MCEISPQENSVLRLRTESSIIERYKTYSTPAEVNMITSTVSQCVQKAVKRSGNTLDRVYKCPNDDCSFILHYKVKLVAVDDHGFLLEEEKDNEAKKQLRSVMVNQKPHSCLDEKEE